jgi:phosphatidylserine/phosphatidylglycerophosphate/cardiolipin synthase-like enzyme
MLPVFNFLLAYSLKNPEKLVILPAVISEHKSGLPGFIAPLITEDLLVGTGIQDHLQLYGEAKSDHSKVFVIDGKSKNPVAFVGSKNLTDASGPFCYDEVAKVSGPAAAIVLDDYYLDMKHALTKVDYTKKPYLLSGYENYLSHLAKNGWSSALYKTTDSPNQMIANVLKPFDLLDRDSEMESSVSSVSIPSQGTALVRNGMTNVDSSRSNLIDQVVQSIKFAQNRILIKDQFIFDRNVVLALIEAKNKAKEEQRNLEVKIILEPLALANPKGMPNLLYLDRLKEVGIEIKWMQTYPFKPFVDGSYKNMNEEQIHALHDISQELHQKTISVDGKFVIAGSANKDQTTMYGAFREAQLDIYDSTAAKVHDDVFYEYWNNPHLTFAFSGFNFKVPENFKGPDGKTLSPQEFIVTIRNILSIFYDWTHIR